MRPLLALAVLACGCVVDEPATELRFAGAVEDALGLALATSASSVNAPGAVGFVSDAAGRTWVGAAGFADTDAGTPMRPTDLFRIGSITKTWVAAGILLLVDEGAVALDAPAETYLPDLWTALPEAPPSPITVERLLAHRSGIVSYTDTGEFLTELREPHTPREIIDYCLDDGLLFEPGTRFAYSNTNYFVLARIIEAVEGRAWHASLRARLLEPNGLEHTWAEGPETPPSLVRGYLEGVDATDRLDLGWTWASGGMVSDARDLGRWLRLLVDGDVLGDDLTARMTTPTPLPDGSLPPYALGMYVVQRGGTMLGHTGSTMGFQSDAFARDGLVVAVLLNDFLSEASDVADALWEVVDGG